MGDAAEKKKPGLAAIIALAKPKKGDSEASDMGEDADDGYSPALDELADVMGIGDDQREAFADAFKAAVMSCK